MYSFAVGCGCRRDAHDDAVAARQCGAGPEIAVSPVNCERSRANVAKQKAPSV